MDNEAANILVDLIEGSVSILPENVLDFFVVACTEMKLGFGCGR